MPRLVLFVFGLSILVPPSVLADDDTDAPSDASELDEGTGARAARRRYDYSRFSDGPRRVPTPRGASLRRAQALGLGTRDTARHLLRRAPVNRWTAAARGAVGDSLVWPVEDGRYGRGFGFTRRERRDLRHNGIDVVAPEGTVVRAVADGIVAYSDNGIRGFGNCVLIIHPNGWVSIYAHQLRTTVQPGWRVTAGERIGFVGSTGISRGPHLHFELRSDGRPIDPARYFARRGHRRSARAAEPPATARDAGDDRRADEELPTEARRAANTEGAHAVGTEPLARHLLRHPADPAMVEGAADRTFSNLLWPVRGGGRATTARRHDVRIATEPGSAVRASADGLVAYAGPLRRYGTAIVLLHANGWVTVYGDVDEIAVEPGQRIRRGEWIARTTETLTFAFRDEGAARPAVDLFVQVPEAP